jgi:predicted 2-oxoglutarate/Fe(II)-dependent dioxygenase YbiX
LISLLIIICNNGYAGAAVIFSCSLLHAVCPVTRGDRYAFFPFLYDDAAGAAAREANNARLGEGVQSYSQTNG